MPLGGGPLIGPCGPIGPPGGGGPRIPGGMGPLIPGPGPGIKTEKIIIVLITGDN